MGFVPPQSTLPRHLECVDGDVMVIMCLGDYDAHSFFGPRHWASGLR